VGEDLLDHQVLRLGAMTMTGTKLPVVNGGTWPFSDVLATVVNRPGAVVRGAPIRS
jgi:hypothetical protein